MESVYIETTVLSYLVARPSRDIVVAGHQATTVDWWSTRREKFSCFVSQVVLDEIGVGDPVEVQNRVIAASPLPALAVNMEAAALAEAILKAQILPIKAIRDAAHIAVCAIHGIDYLLTWNCKHLANARISRRIGRVCSDLGYRLPAICTPETLLEETSDD